MELRHLLTDDRAVSPVIGIILMVAITVILATLTGAFVLEIGDTAQSPPQAQLSFNFTDTENVAPGFNGDADDVVEITHEGGERMKANELTVIGDGANDLTESRAFPSNIKIGDSAEYRNVNSDEAIRVVWSPRDSNTQQTINRANAPV